MQNNITLSRRGLLKGAALAAAGAGMVGANLGSLAVAEEAAQAVEATQASEPMCTPRTAAANLNPQDYDFRSNSGDLSTLFSSWQLGSLTLPNRMVKSAAGSRSGGFGPDAIAAYYGNIARGGAKMVWVENYTSLLPDYLNKDKADLDEWQVDKVVDAIHAEGAYCGYQFDTMAMTLIDGYAGAMGFGPGRPENLSHDDILWLEQQIIAGAKRLQDYGFDAFELNAAGNNVPRTFMSRVTNARDDEFGPQSFENRTRFICDVVRGIKETCGEDFVVQVLINGIEANDENLGQDELCSTVAETKEMAKCIEAAGADSLHVRLGSIGNHTTQFLSEVYFDGYGIEGTTSYGTQFDFKRHWEGKLVADHSGAGLMLNVAAEIKSAVSIPVGAVTYMDPAIAPDFFEAALKEGKVDFFLMNRSLNCDPEYINKLADGRIDEIRPCTRCLHCLRDFGMDGSILGFCRTNACTSRAFGPDMPEGYVPTPAETPKKVMVIGAGPAGMEAARIAAQRGHEVTLYEKSGVLGGLLPFANAIKGPHQNLDVYCSWAVRQLELEGVSVVTGTEVTPEFIAAEAPDAVICATGGKRTMSDLAGTEATPYISIDEFFGAELGEEVAIIGANEQAFDVAQYLQAQGKHVTMVFGDPAAALGKGQSANVQDFSKPMFYALGARVFPQAQITAIGEGQISVQTALGTEETLACDVVIDASDVVANADVLAGVEGPELYCAGDCNEPWTAVAANILYAVAQGNLAGRAV